MTPARGHRADPGQGEALRTELLDAAERLIGELGSADAVSLRRVAREVGVSATAVYLHFADKQDLVIAVCSRRFEAFAAVLRAAREAEDDHTAKLRASGAAYVRFGLEHPAEYRVLFGAVPAEVLEARVPREEVVGLQTLEELADLVAEGMAAGAFRQGEPLPTAVGLWAVCHGLVGALAHGVHDPELDPQQVVEGTLDMVLDGLRPRPRS